MVVGCGAGVSMISIQGNDGMGWSADGVSRVLWAVMFGMFVGLWVKVECVMYKGVYRDNCRRMKVGVWFCLVGLVLLVVSSGGRFSL